jgi:prepilin-type N-terminal cleavage/methylation domain-containing protein
MKDQKGFSLIELLIVVVIIGIIAAIAIPNLMASRRAANEGSAISSLRTIHGAQMTYAATYGNGNYAGVVSTGDGTTILASLNLVDAALGSRMKSGFSFASGGVPGTPSVPATFVAVAFPISMTGISQTGTRVFAIATDGAIFYDDANGTNGLTIATDPSGAIAVAGGIALGN